MNLNKTKEGIIISVIYNKVVEAYFIFDVLKSVKETNKGIIKDKKIKVKEVNI